MRESRNSYGARYKGRRTQYSEALSRRDGKRSARCNCSQGTREATRTIVELDISTRTTGGVVGARAAMLPAVMLKFTSPRSIGMTSTFCAGFPGVSWDIFSLATLTPYSKIIQPRSVSNRNRLTPSSCSRLPPMSPPKMLPNSAGFGVAHVTGLPKNAGFGSHVTRLPGKAYPSTGR